MKLYDPSISTLESNGQRLSIFSLATPVFLQHVSVGLLGTINTILLSGYNQDAVGAIGVANQVSGLISVILMISITGMRIIFGVELGRNNTKEAASISGTAFWAALISSIAGGLIASILADPILTMMNLEGYPKAIATSYMRIYTSFMFTSMISGFFGTCLTCLGHTRLVAFSSVLTHILNAVLGYVVLYGNLNLPFSGTDGLAIRAIVTNLVSIAITGTAFFVKKCPCSFKFSFENLKRIIRIGFPSSMNSLAYNAGQTITTSIIASFGITAVNAKVHVSTITSYVFYFSMSISSATGIIMSRLRGMEDYEKSNRLFWQSVRLSSLLNCCASITIFIAKKPLLGLFTTSPEIIKIASAALLVDIFVETIRGTTNVGDTSLNANGDVRIVSLVSITACWGVTVLFSYLLGVKLGLGLVGCWIAFGLDELFKSSLYVLRWRSGKWRGQRI